MVVGYDLLLVALSIVIAVLGSYTGLRLARQLAPKRGTVRKALLSGAAVSIGCGIWSMHFVGMLAVQLPIIINYDVLLTLVSALVSILVTGLGLFVASYGPPTAARIVTAGLLMGLGISAMHYVGMAAVRGNCMVTYSGGLVAVSVLVGIAASILALWLAFGLERVWQTGAGAVVMGLAISGMHYTAMAAATFLPAQIQVTFAAPALGPHLLAIIVALAAFLIFGFTLLIALPDHPRDEAAPVAPEAPGGDGSETGEPTGLDAQGVRNTAADWLAKLPVKRNQTTLFLDVEQVVSIQAEAHYTRVCDGSDTYFCSHSLSDLEERLDPAVFLRVHRSHIINLTHARAFERRKEQSVIRLSGVAAPSVPVSRRNLPKLRSALGL